MATFTRLEKVAEDGGNFLHHHPQAQPTLAQLQIEFFITALWTLKDALDFWSPLLEPFGMGVPRIGPVAQQAFAEIRVLPEHPAILEPGILLIQNAGAAHHSLLRY